MANSFALTIVTPDKEFLSSRAEQVVFSTPEGRIGLMAGHMAMVAAVAEGMAELCIDGQWHTAAVGQGFVEVGTDKAEFFVDNAEWAEDIDVARANQALQRAQERLHSNLSRMEFLRTQAALARAVARLKAADKRMQSVDRK